MFTFCLLLNKQINSGFNKQEFNNKNSDKTVYISNGFIHSLQFISCETTQTARRKRNKYLSESLDREQKNSYNNFNIRKYRKRVSKQWVRESVYLCVWERGRKGFHEKSSQSLDKCLQNVWFVWFPVIYIISPVVNQCSSARTA